MPPTTPWSASCRRRTARRAETRLRPSPRGGQHDRVTWIAPEVDRPEPPNVASERPALQGWLDFHRATLLWKCSGLDGDQLTARPVQSSTLSLLGLVRHMAEVERSWFRIRFAGQSELGALYCDDEFPDGDFDRTDGVQAERDFAVFSGECLAADEAARDRPLDEVFKGPRTGAPMDLRWIYLHMIEEYARHNGHADLLRELMDGVTGD
jgi:hypothetical protein